MNARQVQKLLWAKHARADHDPSNFHLLICHLIDVMRVCRGLWEACLGDSLREWLANKLGLAEQTAARRIAFWAALHDLGKATVTVPFAPRNSAPGLSHSLLDDPFRVNHHVPTAPRNQPSRTAICM